LAAVTAEGSVAVTAESPTAVDLVAVDLVAVNAEGPAAVVEVDSIPFRVWMPTKMG
jgi:hypothetical protein